MELVVFCSGVSSPYVGFSASGAVMTSSNRGLAITLRRLRE
jgi:hypothetical protein